MAAALLGLARWTEIPAATFWHHDDLRRIGVMIVVVVVSGNGCAGGCPNTGTNDPALLTTDLRANGAAECAADCATNGRIFHDVIVVVGQAWLGEHAPDDKQQSEQNVPTHAFLPSNRAQITTKENRSTGWSSQMTVAESDASLNVT
jgi:hypothetical protein